MKVIIRPRGYGKTTLLVQTAAKNGFPILCARKCNAKIYEIRAKELGLPVPKIFTVNDMLQGRTRGSCYKNFLVDEADDVLIEFMKETSYCTPLIATMTIEEGLTNENS